MRLALLGPIAWRTPPRHYGPWEHVTGLLADGLVSRGVDVTLFATLDSVTPRGTGRCLRPAAMRRTRRRRPRLGGAPRGPCARSLGRVRPRPQPPRLASARLRAGSPAPRCSPRSTGSPPRHPPRLPSVGIVVRVDLRRRPRTGARVRRHGPPRRRSRRAALLARWRRRARLLRPHPSRQGNGRRHRRSRGGPAGRSSSAVRCTTSATSKRRSRPTSTTTASATSAPSVRTSAPPSSARRPASCTRSRSPSRSGCRWSRR